MSEKESLAAVVRENQRLKAELERLRESVCGRECPAEACGDPEALRRADAEILRLHKKLQCIDSLVNPLPHTVTQQLNERADIYRRMHKIDWILHERGRTNGNL